MVKGTARLFALLLIGGIATATLAPALAEEGVEDGKVYRVILTNGKEIVGEVTELEGVYKVKTASGKITQTIRKSQVRQLIPVDEEPSAADKSSLRRRITDAEIEEILGSESVEDLYVWDYIEPIDLMDELDWDEESVQEMKRYAGRQAKWLETPHFVCVYTSQPAAARRLVARLEIVYKWNVTFMRLFDIPPRKPEHKLEIFYFGTHDEYSAYATLNGFSGSGALGFYMRTNNRCAFFDMNTYPPVAAALKASKDKRLPLQERRRLKNRYERYANFMNLAVIQHEATHAMHFNLGVFPKEAQIGNWMTEGLCVQFEVPPTQEGGSFGSINYHRLDLFQKMYGPNAEGVAWQSVRQMILSDSTGFHDYVMGWALNYYLRKERKEEYAKWMQLLAGREDDWSVRIDLTQRLADFEDIFGKVDEEWVQEFFDYIAGIPMKRHAIVEDPRQGP
ncbi:MAG: DUF1570 domain-containing protein [Phycisphaerae bacterium]